MYKLTLETDPMTDKVNIIMFRILTEFDTLEFVKDDYIKRAGRIMFGLGYEYYSSAWLTIMNWQLLGGAALVRVEIENLADMIHVSKDPKRAKKYIETGQNTFVKGVQALEGTSVAKVIEENLLRHVNRWSSSTIDDRVKNAGELTALRYDFYSYFGHPNPGNTVFLSSKKKDLRKKTTNAVLHDHLSVALSMVRLTIRMCDLKDVAVEEIEELAAEFKGELVG